MSEANISQMGEIHQALADITNYKELSMVTLKNPSNGLDKEDLMRVLYH